MPKNDETSDRPQIFRLSLLSRVGAKDEQIGDRQPAKISGVA